MGKLTISYPDQINRARELEKEGQLDRAAALYQGLFEKNPLDTAVVRRLLVLYRKLKDDQREMRVIDGTIAAKKKMMVAWQEEWSREHPKAAKVGRALLKTVRGKTQPGSESPEIMALVTRKLLLSKKVKPK